MKLFFTGTLLILVSLCIAQENWAPTGAVWHYNYSNQFINGYVKIESVGDSIINGKTCKVLQKTRIYNNGFSATIDTVEIGTELTYLENDTVFYYRYGQFFVLYDFSSTAGDIWQIAGEEPNPVAECLDSVGYIIVDSTGNLNINSHSLRTLYIHSPDSSDWSLYGTIIERIGCPFYMFPEVSGSECIVDYYEGGYLRCYYDDEFGLYKTNYYYSSPCDSVYMAGINSEDTEPEISVYPNPAKDYVNILFPEYYNFEEYQISIYNILGIKVIEITVYGSNNKIFVGNLPNACYYIEISDSENRRIVRKLIKNAE